MRSLDMGSIKFNIDDQAHESYWGTVKNKTWQPWIFPIYDRLLSKDHCYIDFGAWVGATTLYASGTARHCYAFEPDPVAFELLQHNVSCNPEIDNITLVNAAIWNETGTVHMSSEGDDLGVSDTSIMLDNKKSGVDVKALTFADFRASLFSIADAKQFTIADCNLIKFDIEGAETIVVEEMLDFLAETKPSIIISIHVDRMDDPDKDRAKIRSMLGFYEYFYNVKTMEDVGSGAMRNNLLITNTKWEK